MHILVRSMVDHASLGATDNLLAYHNREHVDYMFVAYWELYREEPTAEEALAIAYHDVVYVPGAPLGMNEQLSALKFQQHYDRYNSRYFRDGGQLPVDTFRVKQLILATSVECYLHPAKLGPPRETHRVLDCDLAMLGNSDYEVFKDAQFRILSEYTGNYNEETQTLWDLGPQARFLETFLAKEHIYHTPQAKGFEVNARRNIQRLMEEVNIA